jgi:hypothetical protein
MSGLPQFNSMRWRLGRHTSCVVLLSPETADVASNLASAASRLASTAGECTVMGGGQNNQQLSGEMTCPVDFAEFDEHVERFSRAAALDRREWAVQPVAKPLPPGQGASPVVRSPWFSSLSAASR